MFTAAGRRRGGSAVAVAVIYEFPGMTGEKYDRILREALNDELQPGVLAHVAGPLTDGWWAMDVYESSEAVDRLVQKVVERMEDFGITSAPRVMFREVTNLLFCGPDGTGTPHRQAFAPAHRRPRPAETPETPETPEASA
jgi:hypothetical protein